MNKGSGGRPPGWFLQSAWIHEIYVADVYSPQRSSRVCACFPLAGPLDASAPSPQGEMEESSSQKLVWDGDAKAVQQCLTDIFTSVFTTCDVPENAIFGPCVLSHTSLYDSIAFIALKSTDKRTAPYIFRVRPPPRPPTGVYTKNTTRRSNSFYSWPLSLCRSQYNIIIIWIF